MLGYAVETRPARRKASPTTLALIAAGHAALILAVINAKMDVPDRPRDPPTWIEWVEEPIDPAPIPPEPPSPVPPSTTPRPTPLDPIVETSIPLPGPQIELGPPQPIPTGPGVRELPADSPKPLPLLGPKPLTPDHSLRPPYPLAKRRLEEEAVLRLRLAIDERGRVRSVEPVGAADPMFLASARNHLIRNWRYQPATEGGRPIASFIVINLRFEIDDS